MARFRYSMQNLLDIKMKLETQAKQSFAASVAVLNAEQAKLNELTVRRDQFVQEGTRLREGKLMMRELEENHRAITLMEEYIVSQMVVVERAKADVERARETMTEAVMERKTYETLREQALSAFLKEEEKAESKTVDELVSYSYGQKRQVRDNGSQ